MAVAPEVHDDMLRLSFTTGHRSGTLAFEGEIDLSNAASLRPRVLGLLDMPAGHTLRLSLEQLEFCDLTGLEAILGLTSLGHPTVITAGDSSTRRIFELTGNRACLADSPTSFGALQCLAG